MHSQRRQLREGEGPEIMSQKQGNFQGHRMSCISGAVPGKGEIRHVLCEHHEFHEDWQADAVWRGTLLYIFLSLRTALRLHGLPWVWQWAHHHWKCSSIVCKITWQWCWEGDKALGREGVVSQGPSTCETKARLAQWHQRNGRGFKSKQTNILRLIVTIPTSCPCPPF